MIRTLILGALSLFVVTAAASSDTLGPHKKVAGVYRIYGGGLGDPVVPSPKDKKIMFSVEGNAAKEMFDAMGPDKPDVCTEGTGIRVRTRDKDNLFCSRSEKGEYSCNFGFDLRTGKSIGGIVC
jgi:hypothetical protein